MAHKIIVSKLFQKKVIALNMYLQSEWGLAVTTEFNETLVKIILTIADQPGIGSVSKKKKDVRKILITKHNRLYYRVKDKKSILLLILFDTRQNPNRNRYD
jgi:plasmid stabilization system protein ParE